ncbi:MAG: DNA circularization N-terminal domain-containing protein [Aquabacterium sp.]|nr:DNA circularization N-terminal domain-containing protein [Aquabacterium sp.]
MATSKLSDSLRPASFRGVPFQVDSTDLGAGRRTQLHEYPQRDKPWVEDLGRAAREISFDGFVVGADYVAQANQLLAALEEAGPGTLIHPWFGTLTVSLKDQARVSFNNTLGQARFSLSFVESGELAFPLAGNSTAAQSRLAAANIETSAVADFADSFDVAGYQDFVATEAGEDLTSVFGLLAGGSVPGLPALGYATGATAMLQSALGLMTTPLALGQQLAGFLGLAGYVAASSRWAGLARSLTQLVGSAALVSPSAPLVYTPSRQQAYANTRATNALVRQLLLAQAVGASSLVPATVFDESIGLRNTLTAALDAEALTATDAAYAALSDARGKVWRDLTERARDGARLTTLTPPDTTPALVLAYDYYEDAERADDIVARNGIRHPGFVPPLPLKVLTR